MSVPPNIIRIELIKSNRNKEKAVVEGFIYTLNRTNGNIYYWVCEKRGTCSARINTKDEYVIKPTNIRQIVEEHTHAPIPGRIDMLKSYSNLKEAATNSEQSTRGILSKELETIHTTTINEFPKLESVKRTIRTYKSRGIESCGHPENVSDIIIPDKYRKTHKGEPFLFFDSGFGDERRMIIFATPKFLSILSESRDWYCDGTFKVVPDLFFQLYTIHAEKERIVIPCVYALLVNKEESTYDTLFRKLLELEPTLNPFSVMVDFEKAAINALENNFISVISGCFFHLAQNVYRKVQIEGLVITYREDYEFALKIKMLPSLAYVPEIDVIDSFNLLMQDFPASAKNIGKYFEDNYIGKPLPNGSRRMPLFPIRLWNMYSRVTNHQSRTNNHVEGWHNAFQSTISCTHPSIGKILTFLQREQSLQEAILAKWEAGEVIQASKLSQVRNERVESIVSKYQSRERLTYLRAVA